MKQNEGQVNGKIQMREENKASTSHRSPSKNTKTTRKLPKADACFIQNPIDYVRSHDGVGSREQAKVKSVPGLAAAHGMAAQGRRMMTETRLAICFLRMGLRSTALLAY